jgi:hypothetical protein
MSKPSEDEIKQALAEAVRMREQGDDPHFLAKTLLNHHYRLGYLQEVLQAVERYLHSGMAEPEHAHLLRTLEKARRAEERTAKVEHRDLGLG